MPDHLHAFVAIDDQRLTLSMWMKSLKNALSRTLRGQDVPSPHWQKGFFDHILRSAESFGGKWSYVRETRYVPDWLSNGAIGRSWGTFLIWSSEMIPIE